jgi:regulator of protease activity HflC (stomatin/prohibitin superfamily)
MIIVETIFIVLVMIFLAFSTRAVTRQQRIALFRLGRYAGLKGPGVIIVVPFVDRDCKITIGDQGVLVEDGKGKFQEFQVPVVFTSTIPTGASIKVIGFAKERLQVE